MAVNGGTLANKEASCYYRKKKSYPPPTPCTLLLSSQVCELRLRGVIRARTTKQRILGEGSDDMEQSTLGSGGFSPSDSFLPAWFKRIGRC